MCKDVGNRDDHVLYSHSHSICKCVPLQREARVRASEEPAQGAPYRLEAWEQGQYLTGKDQSRKVTCTPYCMHCGNKIASLSFRKVSYFQVTSVT